MSLPDEALRKLLQELNDRVVTSSKAINGTRTLITQKERERRLIELTRRELRDVDEKERGEKVWKGVGKMFVMEDVKSTVAALERKDIEATEDIQSLGKKLKYYENEVQQASGGLKEIFERSKRQ